MRTSLIAAVLVLAVLSAAAQQPLGDQFLAGPPGDFVDARDPVVAIAGSGAFTIAWYATYLAMSSKRGVYARRFNNRGNPTGDVFMVNTSTAYHARVPRVAMTPFGDMVIVWVGGVNEHRVYFQRYDASGSSAGGETEVSDIRIGTVPRTLDVAMDLYGKFVVVWFTEYSPGTDTDSYAIVARRFGVNGTPIGDVFQVNDYTADAQVHPRVAMNDTGAFVVTWRSTGSPGTDQSHYSIQARLFEFDGPGSADPQFQVNQTTIGEQEEPDVGMNRTGDFVITWASEVDGGDQGIMGRAYGVDGTPDGDEFRIDGWPYGLFVQQDAPAVAVTEMDDFYVAWYSHQTLTGDDPLASIAGREYYSAEPPTDQFQINTETDNYQDDAGIASDSDGGYVVTWWDWDGIHARRFATPYYLVFSDGFESGSTGSWDSAQ